MSHLAEQWIADHVKIRKAGDSERLTNPVATRLLEVKQKLRCSAYSQTCEQSEHMGSGILCFGRKAVWPLVGRTEGRVPLRDEIGLTGKPYAISRKMRRWDPIIKISF